MTVQWTGASSFGLLEKRLKAAAAGQGGWVVLVEDIHLAGRERLQPRSHAPDFGPLVEDGRVAGQGLANGLQQDFVVHGLGQEIRGLVFADMTLKKQFGR